MSHEPPAKCDDPTTWNHKDEKIDLSRLLALIEAHGGSDGLDLHGCDMTGIDLSYAALSPYLQRWTGTQPPPWVYGIWGINLRGAHLEEAKFTSANLDGADLSLASLKRAFFFNTRVDNVSFVRCNAEQVSLLHASAREAGFQNARLVDASLMATDFRESQFDGANLQRARLLNSHLEGLDFRLADLRGAMLHGARLEKTKLRPANTGRRVGEELVASGRQDMHYRVSYFEAADVYLDLKANFSALGYYDAVSWAYVKERQMEKMAYFQEWTRRGRGLFGNPIRWIRLLDPRRHSSRRWFRLWSTRRTTVLGFWRWLRNWAYELLTGYGERPFLPVLWGLVVILAFAGGYAAAGNIAPDFAGDPATAEGSHSFMDALTHSIAAFATIGFNTLEPLGWGARLLTAIEVCLRHRPLRPLYLHTRQPHEPLVASPGRWGHIGA